jgi:hypothetical protein
MTKTSRTVHSSSPAPPKRCCWPNSIRSSPSSQPYIARVSRPLLASAGPQVRRGTWSRCGDRAGSGRRPPSAAWASTSHRVPRAMHIDHVHAALILDDPAPAGRAAW